MNDKLKKLVEQADKLLPASLESLGGTPVEKAQLVVSIEILGELKRLNERLENPTVAK